MLCQRKQGTNRALLKFLGFLTSVNVGKKSASIVIKKLSFREKVHWILKNEEYNYLKQHSRLMESILRRFFCFLLKDC